MSLLIFMPTVAIILLSAHVYGDFLLQTNTIAQRKHRLGWLLVHSLIHGALAYALLQQWTAWQAPVLVVLAHSAIDAVKSRCPRSAATFAGDQAAHVLSVLLIAWWAARQGWSAPFAGFGGPWIVGLAGFCATVRGVGFFVGEVTDRIISENSSLRDALRDGLKDGGKRIGQLERAVIFILILAGAPTGIGFLIGAKSILRFEEAKKQQVAEYVLIGTLWSFALAMLLAWLTKRALESGGVF